MNWRAYIILTLMPLFFGSNLVISRPAVETIAPWTLATLRWGIASLVMLPFVATTISQNRQLIARHARTIALLGFLGMWCCGGFVYMALRMTTATNGTLIYTASPVIVVLMAALIARRALPLTEALGVALGVAGVFIVVLRGDPMALLHLNFNIGDLGFVFAAIAWAVYSLILKRPGLERIPTAALFTLIALSGALMLLPGMIVELVLGAQFPVSPRAWISIAGLVIFSSILSFTTYQYSIKIAGPSVTSVFMYLLPCYGVALAAIFLGEELHLYHAIGLAFVLAGIVLATGSHWWTRRSIAAAARAPAQH